ncbi:MAG: hypothetical protein GY716_08035 [bacterium]|nr:hypothetical protein [bacterium]
MKRTLSAIAKAILLAALVAAPGGIACADTILVGPIDTDTVLTAADSPYLVTSDLDILGAKLTLEAGVTLRLADGVGISVQGSLDAQGTAASPVVITSDDDAPGSTPAAGDWSELVFTAATVSVETILRHTEIRYGETVRVEGSSPTIENTTLRTMSGPAIQVDLAAFPEGVGNSAVDCGLNGILVPSGVMTADGRWGLVGIPYVVQGRVEVGVAPTVTGLDPIVATLDSTTPVLVFGTRLIGTTGVTFDGTGVTAQVSVLNTNTILSLLVDVAVDAPLGARTFVVDAAAGLTTDPALTLEVIPGTPVLEQLSPAFVLTGSADTPISLSGSRFYDGSTVRIDSSDVPTTLVGPTELQTTLGAASLAADTTLSLSVANEDFLTPGQFLTSSALQLVVAGPPSVGGISPDTGVQGTSVFADLQGDHLWGIDSFTFSGTGLTPVLLAGGTPTSRPLRIDVDPAAPTGPQSFDLTAPLGSASSGSVVFTVIVPVPSIDSLSPQVVAQNAGSVAVTIDGSGFTPLSIVEFRGESRPVTYVGPTRLVLALTGADTSIAGSFAVQVINEDGSNPALTQESNSEFFSVSSNLVLSAFVALRGTNSAPDNRVAAISTESREITDFIEVGSFPTGVAVSPDEERVYVANLRSNSVSVIDPETNLVVDTMATSSPWDIAITQDSSTAYISNRFGGSVTELDLQTQTPTTLFGAGILSPTGVAITTDPINGSERVYVANAYSYGYGGVGAIDTATGTVSGIDTTIYYGWDVAAARVGTRVFVGSGYFGYSNSTIDVIDSDPDSPTFNTTTHTLDVSDAGTPSEPRGLEVGSTVNGERLFAALATSNQIVEIDTGTLAEVNRASTGAGTEPWRVTLTPDGSELWVSMRGMNQIQVLDAATLALLDTIDLPSRPHSLAFVPAIVPEPEPVDLTLWSPELYSGTGNWTLSGDGFQVTEPTNGEPNVFCSTTNAFVSELIGELRVNGSSDDDFVGFALGFSPGDTSNPGADYVLVDWKRGNQSSGARGIAVSRVLGVPTPNEFWTHTGHVTELARAINLGDTGWAFNRWYRFTFEFDAGSLKIFVDGTLEIDITGTFNDGRFCFYTYSQPNASFRAFVVP